MEILGFVLTLIGGAGVGWNARNIWCILFYLLAVVGFML